MDDLNAKKETRPEPLTGTTRVSMRRIDAWKDTPIAMVALVSLT
jgi:hypothetical protein